MALKLFESVYYNPSFLLTLMLFLPYMYLSPIPVKETLYQQFINNISVKKCHIPFGNKLPFINCTGSIECLSSTFKQCDTPDSITPKEKTFLLCKEIFDNLNIILCQNNKFFESFKETHALSNQVCEGFNGLKNAIPRKEQYLGSRLTDDVVCEVVCSNKFSNLCKILLWSYEVQNIMKDLNTDFNNLEGNVNHVLTDQLGSIKGSVSGKMDSKQADHPKHKQQQPGEVNALDLQDADNVGLKSTQPKNDADMDSKLKPNIGVEKEGMIEPGLIPHINIEQNDTTVKNIQTSSKNGMLNAIPGSNLNAQRKESSLVAPEAGSTDKHILNVKILPNKITDSPEAHSNLPGARLTEKATNVLTDQNAWGIGQETNNTVKKQTLTDQHDDEPVANLDEDEVQGIRNDNIGNGHNLNVKSQLNVDGIKNQISENNSHVEETKPEIKGGSGVQNQNNGGVENNVNLHITDNADIEDVQNNMKSSFENHQTEVKGTNTVDENKGPVTDVPGKNISDQKNIQDVTPKQDIKDAEIQSNNLNSKTIKDNVEFDQDGINTDTPLEKMDDSDIHQPHDQNQYNDVECNEGDVEGDYERSDYDVAVYQHTKSNEPESKVTDVADIPPEIKNEFPKTFDGFSSKTSNIRGSDGIQVIPSFPEQEDSHFIFYFLSIVLILMVGYVIFHNKQKIIALIVEGRHERRRRSHGVGYKKLETK